MLLLALLLAASSPFRVGVSSVVVIGDSITRGYLVGDSYPAVLSRSVSVAHPVINAGLDGDTSSGIWNRWSRTVAPDADIGFVVVLGGVNDVINGALTGAQAYANLKLTYDDVRARGIALAVVTVLPCKLYSAWTSAKQSQMDALNTSIRSYASTYSAVLIDGYALMGDADPQALKASYANADGLHPSQAGASYLASQIKSALGL